MSFRSKFKLKEKSLSRQHKVQIANKDLSGAYPTVVMKDKLPAGIEMWKCSTNDHIIDILPFPAGPDFPIDPSTKVKIINEGDFVYVLDLAIHKNVGPMKLPFVCPTENYGLPCPICEYMSEVRLEKDDWKNIKAKRTTFYLIWVHDSRETEKKGIYLWEASHFIFEEKLNVIAKIPKGGGAINFAHPDTGKSIAFTKEGKGGSNVSYLGHRLIDREMTIPDKLLDMTFSVDTIINTHPPYEEIEKAFHAQKAKLSKDGDVDNAGKAFSSSGANDEEEIPEWMKQQPGDSEVDPDSKVEVKPKVLRKKLLLKKKPKA